MISKHGHGEDEDPQEEAPIARSVACEMQMGPTAGRGYVEGKGIKGRRDILSEGRFGYVGADGDNTNFKCSS